MKANLDKLIKDARDDVPDSGEYRRLNRVMLKERMATTGLRHRHHRVLLVTLSLVFLMMFSGQLNQLGSDRFDVIGEDVTNPDGETFHVLSNEFRGNSFNVPDDFSSEDIDELNRAMVPGEGELAFVLGISYGGKTDWMKVVKRVINGKIDFRNLSSTGGTPDNYDDFLSKHIRDIGEKTRTTPHQRETVMTFDWVVCNMKIWVFHFPEFGEVIRYIGTPIQ